MPCKTALLCRKPQLIKSIALQFYILKADGKTDAGKLVEIIANN